MRKKMSELRANNAYSKQDKKLKLNIQTFLTHITKSVLRNVYKEQFFSI